MDSGGSWILTLCDSVFLPSLQRCMYLMLVIDKDKRDHDPIYASILSTTATGLENESLNCDFDYNRTGLYHDDST